MNGNIEREILGEYADQGFSLEEDSDEALLLYFKGTMIAAFQQTRVKPEDIQAACRRFEKGLTNPVGVVL